MWRKDQEGHNFHFACNKQVDGHKPAGRVLKSWLIPQPGPLSKLIGFCHNFSCLHKPEGRAFSLGYVYCVLGD